MQRVQSTIKWCNVYTCVSTSCSVWNTACCSRKNVLSSNNLQLKIQCHHLLLKLHVKQSTLKLLYVLMFIYVYICYISLPVI